MGRAMRFWRGTAGRANLIFNPEYYLYYSNQKFLAPDGKCKSFDARGDGFGRGEGLGPVILKPCRCGLWIHAHRHRD